MFDGGTCQGQKCGAQWCTPIIPALRSLRKTRNYSQLLSSGHSICLREERKEWGGGWGQRENEKEYELMKLKQGEVAYFWNPKTWTKSRGLGFKPILLHSKSEGSLNYNESLSGEKQTHTIESTKTNPAKNSLEQQGTSSLLFLSPFLQAQLNKEVTGSMIWNLRTGWLHDLESDQENFCLGWEYSRVARAFS